MDPQGKLWSPVLVATCFSVLGPGLAAPRNHKVQVLRVHVPNNYSPLKGYVGIYVCIGFGGFGALRVYVPSN